MPILSSHFVVGQTYFAVSGIAVRPDSFIYPRLVLAVAASFCLEGNEKKKPPKDSTCRSSLHLLW